MRFSKPTPEEVTNYAYKIGFILDGHEFCDYYESKGWVVGKSPMKVWQAAVRTWKYKEVRQDRFVKKKEQPQSDPEKVKLAKERSQSLMDREWQRQELARLAKQRDDARSRKMMEATGEKFDDESIIPFLSSAKKQPDDFLDQEYLATAD